VIGSKPLLVPAMEARLISGLHPDAEIAGRDINASNHCVLRMPGQIAVANIRPSNSTGSERGMVGGKAKRHWPDLTLHDR
jgi:hypothetical protein